MSIADKALWIIERNSDAQLTLGAIARACGVSRSHLANVFSSASGRPVMNYLRARRLTKAARLLANGAPDILNVALDAGYGSHEAFTRAFRDLFGLTPESVRDRGTVDGLSVISPLELTAKTPARLGPPRVEREAGLLVVGLSEPCSSATTINIPSQWQRFMSQYETIPYKRDRIPIGVCQAADEDGRFAYLCGVEVSRFGQKSAELTQLTIGASRYAVFEHHRHVSKIFETYDEIWNRVLPASGLVFADAPVLERHHPSFDPGTGEGGLSLWIPVAG